MDYVASAFVFAPECAKVCSLSGRAFGRVSIRRSRGIIREVSCYGRPEAGATPEGAAPGEGLFMAYVGQDWMPVVDLLQGGLWLVLTACLLRVLKRAGSSGKEALK
ncbi:MAG: hypothetical protein JOZ96_26405 [Acidobacteria bacterium]|nr:hypothetical protein [Acidobacteriota bacterium]